MMTIKNENRAAQTITNILFFAGILAFGALCFLA